MIMTGKPAFRYNFLNEEIQLEVADDSLWNKVVYFSNKGFLLGGGTLPQDELPPGFESIVDRHAYAILDAFEFDGNRLLLLKDPRGCSDWAGKWSPESSRWTSRLKEMLHQRLARMATKRKGSRALVTANTLKDFASQQSQGIFFMSWEELMECFEVIFVTIFFDEAWGLVQVSNTWREEADNSLIGLQSACGRAQYLLIVPKDMEIFCLLAHKIPNSHCDIPKIGFEVHKYKENGVNGAGTMAGLVAIGRYSAERRVSLNCELERGKYVVSLVTCDVSISESFLFTVWYPKEKTGEKKLDLLVTNTHG
eukprot:TRINITY_DN12130_c0_g1_i3.p1 TRINITY_DN12130_c0_g1~~TRINITY_DN12130_c0_g1_i3.p1  ORF type:complete len:309 (-),score=59.71 TRINITY_DN12130_c0_g1_i3:145-1071(-)